MSRGPVAKERGRNDIRLGQFVEPESQAAKLGRHQQHGTTTARLGERPQLRTPRRRPRNQVRRQELARDGAKPDGPGNPRFEAWSRDASG